MLPLAPLEIIHDHGILIYRLTPGGVAEIVELGIDNNHRREGVGRKLLRSLIKQLPLTVTNIYAFTRQTNYIARDWYKAMGFKEYPISPFYDTGDAILEVRPTMRLLYVSDFSDSTNHGRDEFHIANCLWNNHAIPVTRIHGNAASAASIIREMTSHDAMLFANGKIGTDESGELMAYVCKQVPKPCYLWCFDKMANFGADRKEWCDRILPAVDIAFVTDPELPQTYPDVRTVLLRQGYHEPDTQPVSDIEPDVFEYPLIHLGGLYGRRVAWANYIKEAFTTQFRGINNVFGPRLAELANKTCLLISPDWPNSPGYWSNRLQIAAGHGFGMLVANTTGLAEEGFIHQNTCLIYNNRTQLIQLAKSWLGATSEYRLSLRRRCQAMARSRHRWADKVSVLAGYLTGQHVVD